MYMQKLNVHIWQKESTTLTKTNKTAQHISVASNEPSKKLSVFCAERPLETCTLEAVVCLAGCMSVQQCTLKHTYVHIHSYVRVLIFIAAMSIVF